MKTVEEKAREYSYSKQFKRLSLAIEEAYKDGYNEGCEDSKKWISVKDEFPPIKKINLIGLYAMKNLFLNMRLFLLKINRTFHIF